MSIAPVCRMCKNELNTPGAILLGPPDADDQCRKDHLCATCYQIALRLMESYTRQVPSG
jgi:hypothetical protein